MGRRLGVMLAVTAACLLSPHGAAAATEFGDECLANAAEPGYTMTQLERASASGLPLTAPSEGILTSWTVRVAPGFPVEAAPVRLKVLRAAVTAGAFRVVGESADARAAMPAFTQDARIAVRAGDRLGLYSEGDDGTLACSGAAERDLLGTFKGDALSGFEYAFAPVDKFRLPVSAKLEPDDDGDGYGDESQDACPKSAAYHEGCPIVRLEITEFWVRRHSIVLRLTASSPAKVHVYGQVGWGFRPRRKPNKGKPTRLIVGLSGGTKTARPGRESTFRIQLPKPVLLRLDRISPHESLKAKVTATTTDLAGRVEKGRLTLRLKGRDSG